VSGYKTESFRLVCAKLGVAVAAVVAEKGEEVAHDIDVEAVGDRATASFRVDESSLVQLFEVKRECWLGNAELFGDVTGAEAICAIVGQQAEYFKARWLS